MNRYGENGGTYFYRKDDYKLLGMATDHDQEKHYESEPEAGLWRNIEVDLFAILPLEDQL